jgi:hypothetical protein
MRTAKTRKTTAERALGAALGAALALGWSAGEAWAYTRTTTCTPSGTYQCEPGQEPLEIAWPSACVTYHLHREGLSGVPFAQVEADIQASFEPWNEPGCGNLTLTYGGTTDEDRVEFDLSCDNVNTVVFREESWDYLPGTVALTTVLFGLETGTIYDADMEINAVDFDWAVGVDQTPNHLADLRNTITHEAGHFLGLDHTNVGGATMEASAGLGETLKRDLAQDDIDGLCAIYPSPAQDQTCRGAPVGPYLVAERVCEDPQLGSGEGTTRSEDGCACAVGAGQRGAWGLAGILMGALALLRRGRGGRA